MAFPYSVQVDYGNFSFGPVAGNVYSIDHASDIMVVKTLGGSFVATIPLDTGIQSEVLELAWDGYYFWILSIMGVGSSLGRSITKWKLNSTSTLLEKQINIGDGINLINSSLYTYDASAFCIQIFKTYAASSISIGATQANLGNVEFLSIGDSIYLGPTPIGLFRERTVTGISGNIVYFVGQPLDISFLNNAQIIYRKNIWIFNNYNHTNSNGGSLIQVNSYKGYIETYYSNVIWKHVTAATCYNGNLAFIRESQLVTYKPFGSNAGFQTSYHLSNILSDNTTVIDAADVEIDSSTIYKLQKKRRNFNAVSRTFEDQTAPNDKYDIDTEILASKVTSLTARRDTNSILFGRNALGRFTVKVLDQYNNPVAAQNVTIEEDDAVGIISPGYTSFTTNVSGEGITQYNSVSGTFRQPLIMARLTPTGNPLNVRAYIDQIPYEDGIFLIDQVSGTKNQGFINQTVLSSSGSIVEQVSGTTNQFNIIQSMYGNEMEVVQYELSSSGWIEQLSMPLDITTIEQSGDIDNFTLVTQYEFLFYASPLPYSEKNPVTTDIILRVIGFGNTPLNTSTLIFKVNGVDVSSSVVITTFGSGLQIYYNPPINFPYSSTVSIFVSIKDTDTIPRTISLYYTFNITSDYKKPILYSTYPPNNSIDNLPNTLIYGIIKDLETGINIDSIEMYVEGRKVNHTSTLIDLNTVKVSYTSSIPFAYQSEVSVSIYARDYEDNSLIGSWTFYIKDSAGVLFINMNPESCSVLVPVDSNICSELYGLEDGINLKTLEFKVGEKEVTYLLKPKILRVE